MNGTLVFGKDGVLRVKIRHSMANNGHALIPLKECGKKERDNEFLSRLQGGFELEEGSTFLSILLCLMPWKELAGSIAQMNIPAWVAALKRGLKEPCEETNKFLAVILQEIVVLNVKHDFLQETPKVPAVADKNGLLSLRDVFGITTPLITNQLRLENRWDTLLLADPAWDWVGKGSEPLLEGEVERIFSISFTEPALLARLPVKIRKELILYDSTRDSPFLSEDRKKGLLADNNPFIIQEGYLASVKIEARVTMEGTLLRGLLWDIGFHGNPEDTFKTASSIKESLDGIRGIIGKKDSGTSQTSC